MSDHPAIGKDNVAVITGAADGIGLAAAEAFAARGMRVCMADVDAEKLEKSAAGIEGALALPTDVSRADEVERLRDRVLEAYGRVDVLMNNAGIGRLSTPWGEPDAWRKILDVNLYGIINGVQTFTQTMVDQGTPGLIVNTGSKQGITTPPGNPAYNVSKAGVKALTEALQHGLRETEGCRVSAHLLVPGFTYSGMMRPFFKEKPDGAWSTQQVIDFLLEAVARGDFYIICPDNEVTPEMDARRMAWAMGDLIENRPPLSRWHPDYAEKFTEFAGS